VTITTSPKLEISPYLAAARIKLFNHKSEGGTMKPVLVLTLALTLGLFTACSSSQDRAYKAQEQVSKQRLELIEKYEKCMQKAGDDEAKKQDCEQYLKAAEALK
jgi:hypothetical protein